MQIKKILFFSPAHINTCANNIAKYRNTDIDGSSEGNRNCILPKKLIVKRVVWNSDRDVLLFVIHRHDAVVVACYYTKQI